MDTRSSHSALLQQLVDLIQSEQHASQQRLLQRWEQPLEQKLLQGWTQGFTHLERREDGQSFWAYLDTSESRFREGDLLCLHQGAPLENPLQRQAQLELEDDQRWLLRCRADYGLFERYTGGVCYADLDQLDLSHYYYKTLEEVANSQHGQTNLLPLLSGQLLPSFNPADYEYAELLALSEGYNAKQAQAVALGYAAETLTWIQGPPGTGKTRVLSLIARLLVERGEQLLITAHTHMAINHALNKIYAQGVPVVKVGPAAQRRGLEAEIPSVESLDNWPERPRAQGYVVGATPFATCNQRLEFYDFDCVIFDEASQITIPLALMAMRKCQRYIFIGDQQQLPPVLLSRSVLETETCSIFSRLTDQHSDHGVMLEQTYRMNRWLSAWPSQQFYAGRLHSVGANTERRLALHSAPRSLAPILHPAHSAVFVVTPEPRARHYNRREAQLVVAVCQAVHADGLALADIGIITPYRAQGRLIRGLLAAAFGYQAAKTVIADTVERMQGQERELIILSLSSSDPQYLQSVAEFFFQPQRLNVSITRAMTKLIIIGPLLDADFHSEHPQLQSWITTYQQLIKHCPQFRLNTW